jgi:hypothetical protein
MLAMLMTQLKSTHPNTSLDGTSYLRKMEMTQMNMQAHKLNFYLIEEIQWLID